MKSYSTSLCLIPSLSLPRKRSQIYAFSSQKPMQPLDDVITDAGLVKYSRLMENPSRLERNIQEIKQHKGLGAVEDRKPDDLAFYCNAYNMWSMYLAYQKLKETDQKWKGNLSLLAKAQFFRFTAIEIAGKRTNLQSLENNVIRKYGDARIHFAINCSSMSCPALPKYLFQGDQLETQFDEQARRFINGDGVRKEGESYSLNPIFKWFKKDFEASPYGSVLEFLNQYRDEKIPTEAKVGYFAYDWHVNWDKTE